MENYGDVYGVYRGLGNAGFVVCMLGMNNKLKLGFRDITPNNGDRMEQKRENARSVGHTRVKGYMGILPQNDPKRRIRWKRHSNMKWKLRYVQDTLVLFRVRDGDPWKPTCLGSDMLILAYPTLNHEHLGPSLYYYYELVI